MPLPALRISVRRAMGLIGGLAPLLALFARVVLTPGDREIQAMGEGLVARIEAWRTRHGRDPRSLDAAGPRFSLSIGKANGVQIQQDYTSDQGRWYCPD